MSNEEIGPFILKRTVESEMKKSFIDYAMSVITSRALPDVRDGLKPVHRRILYAMNEMGLTHNKPFKKSARIVGEVLGKYHPHGDQAVYDALVRMAQWFSLRYPLVEGQGNFGSIDGDNPAAMRYTEIRLDRIASTMLEDIEKETVDWMDNFDGTLKEPTVLPARLPNLLINGSSGIAVGMATNMPPHNLREIIDGIIKVIDNPEISIAELMDTIKGPDFPTGGIICGRSGILEAYSTGRGRIKVRAKTYFEEKERTKIIVTEIPYMVNKSKLLEDIAELVKDKKIEGIADLRDESDRKGLRIVIELKRDAVKEVVLNQLFEHTNLQTTYGILNLALVKGEPKILSLKDLIRNYIDFRIEIVTRRTSFDLKKAKEKLHILDGLLIALKNIDKILNIIRGSKEYEDAKQALMKRFSLSEIQAKAILDMRLHKLTGMESKSVEEDHKKTTEHIKKLEEILSDKKNILKIIKEELLDLKEKFGDERRTEISEEAPSIEIEDLIPEEEVVVVITNTGYIKRLPIDIYRTQRRGGKGLKGMETKEEDFIVDSFITSTHSYIMFFTNYGKVFWLKGYQIPEGSRHSKGKPIINLLPRLTKDEKIETAIPVKEFDDEHFIVFATKKGLVKKTPLSAYKNIRANGIIAIKLNEGDELVNAKLSNGKQTIMIATRNGQACMFDEKEVRGMGRSAHGVIGIRLKKDDEVVSMDILEEKNDILCVTENGYGKRSPVKSYRKTHRGSKGVRTIITNERNGKVIFVKEVEDEDEIMLTSKNGMMVRVKVKDIRRQGRNTMGVRIMRLNPDDKVVSVAKVVEDNKKSML
jgi:DNA gyrase subunit A